MRYSAFISYNHRDRAWAAWLHRSLENYRFPKGLIGRDSPLGPLERKLPPVFQDREELAASPDLAQSVRDALDEAASLIVICSTNGARSKWVNEEVRHFVGLGRRHRIQCLIVPENGGGLPLGPEAIFPPALIENDVEPLAADARKLGDGKRVALLKLIAGLAGVGYDELRQREAARRQRRLLALATASAIGFMIMSALTVFALLSRSEAIRQRDIARQKTMTAERTTDFVKDLFKVSDPSEAKGAKVTALQILDRGNRQIEGSLGAEPNVKADIMATLAEVYLGLGYYRRADGLVHRSLTLAIDDPATRARQFAVLADSQAQQSDYAAAVRTLDKGIAHLEASRQAGNFEIYTRMLAARGEAHAALNDFAAAEADIAKALQIDEAQAGPKSPAVARDLESAGLAHDLGGKLDLAGKDYERALAIRLATQGPMHPRVSEDENQLGTIAYFQGDLEHTEQYFKKSLAADQLVLGPDHPDLAASLNNLARILIERRKFREAIPLLQRSASINLAQRDETHEDLAFVFSNLALALRGTGDWAGAAPYYAKALQSAEIHKHRLLAPIMTDLAELHCHGGDTAQGMALLDKAAPLMRETYPDDAWRSAWVQNTRGYCFLASGDRDRARPLIEETAPILAKRWAADSLYGVIAADRQKQLDRPEPVRRDRRASLAPQEGHA